MKRESKDALGIRHNAKTQTCNECDSAPFGGGASLGAKAPRLADTRDALVIGSSEQVHVVDALAITGDEGRGSLRKAVGSWQTSFDPPISEWGNPARMGHPRLNT